MTTHPSNRYSIAVEHVSETAWLVAAHRLKESSRPDAYFRDTLATKLLGDQLPVIIQKFPNWEFGEWMMTIRTTLIDRSLMEWIEKGTKTVVNLAAGLDTRPYRLNLPQDLLWIEVDYPPVIEYKNECLKDDPAQCRLERLGVDLADSNQRKKFIKTLSQTENTLILTEGLLYYLKPEAVQALSHELKDEAKIQTWVMDLFNPKMFEFYQKATNTQIDPNEPQVLFEFIPENGFYYFENQGWKILKSLELLEESKNLNRDVPEKLKMAVCPGASTGSGVAVLEPQK